MLGLHKILNDIVILYLTMLYMYVYLCIGTPYKGNIKQQPLSDESKSNKSILGQRVMSAKMLRFKQLQNQLADAHYHLNVS